MEQETGKPHRDAYAAAGVDIAAGNALVEAIRPVVQSTARPGSNPDLGGFGGLFDIAACGFRDPVLVSATDGVGTKLLLAIAENRIDGLGIDLVAMSVNDLVVQGATPLFFLDYLATSRLDVERARRLIAGIADGCRQAGCALIGGETAEMPDVYKPGDFDLAGFAVGAVERDAILPRPVQPGDRLLGLASSGVHSNGYSLVRKLIAEHGGIVDETLDFLAPTRIYVQSCLAAARTGKLQALAHITGGGLLENIPRFMGKGLVARIDARRWTLPPIFSWLARMGRLSDVELARTFNCGIGMVAAARAGDAGLLRNVFEEAGETVFDLGEIVLADDPHAVPLVQIDHTGTEWPCAEQQS
ncbi:MAG: phosphoribosylformylglycinamidine cyclo-ligase [Geminicoccaceae bacterium]|nr:phosphoribosylformylglycinamidine cyclo-ligase [Geminicoccaceae bacterium]